ncbi:MAG: acetoacetate--CoA ligase [Robiginitomaculum sp.]|nr:MAG: acetoacetate--CoA ligase [Robiginitomaculum sp.]
MRTLWTPNDEQKLACRMGQFAKSIANIDPTAPDAYAQLHAWSIEDPARFWRAIWDECGLKGDPGARVLVNSEQMPGAQFFPDGRLNVAENLIERGLPSDEALVFWTEDGRQACWTRNQLKEKAGRYAAAFRGLGIKPGDRIAAIMPNMPQTIAAFLGAAWVGAVFSSASPDFGVGGVTDRFGQIEPKILIACDGYRYGGKIFDVGTKLKAIAKGIPSLEHVVVVPYEGTKADFSDDDLFMPLDRLMKIGEGGGVPYKAFGFNHPLYILFSSGTTGKPKCIVHSAGGALIQQFKEHQLHCDNGAGSRVFFYSTCGWMMWNWLVAGLGGGSTILLYDGSPFAMDGRVLFRIADREKADFFGISAKWIDAVHKSGQHPKAESHLSHIRMIGSTGSPLSPEGFSFIADEITPTAQIASMSGGTDIVSCFVLGNPLQSVYEGEIQGPGLGMAVEVWDDDGKPVVGQKGELVCVKPFPSLPVGFWNDEDNVRYKAAYFGDYPNIWRHGDWAEITEHGGVIIHGRSDATLNPGGVRIGTAEIYNQVEQIPAILDSVCVGQDWQDDVRVILFVVLRGGVTLDEALIKEIKGKIRKGASPRHVPAKIIAVADIPRTKSGKITELAVRDLIHNRAVKNSHALANSEALALFKDLPELQN